MRLPIGSDNFRELIDNNLDFVDKSLFIKEVIDDSTKIILITRPRRFGKTLNLSMLQYFFASQVLGRSTQNLFNHLKIAQLDQDYLQYQGKRPVIFITLKDIKDGSFEQARSKLIKNICDLYIEHRELLTSLSDEDKEKFQSILRQEPEEQNLTDSLKDLCRYMYSYYGTEPILLIDEYDTPIQYGWLNGYYREIVDLVKCLFGATLKTNPFLHKAVLTGILRIAKESLFSDINNVEVYSMFRPQYSSYFGFTDEEVRDLLIKAKLQDQSEQIRNWYNGYQMGNTIIYNPWSIVHVVKNCGELVPYWVNTSGNDLIKECIAKASTDLKSQFEYLLQGQPITRLISENFVFGDINTNQEAVWSLLLFSGYLKAKREGYEGTDIKCQLLIPNQEVAALYHTMFIRWFIDPVGLDPYQHFLQNLIAGRMDEFELMLNQFLSATISYFDVENGRYPEKFYHGFVLGMIASLQKTHVIKSNRESGYGRYDVMIIPKDMNKLGIIMEFKRVEDENQDLKQMSEEALQQVSSRDYDAELKQLGISKILTIGMAFYGKKVKVAFC